MESAENREQPIKASQQKKISNSSSLSKTETLKLLNDSIDQLKQTIEKIDNNSVSSLPSSDSINTLLTTTQELVNTATLAVPNSVPVDSQTSLTEATPLSTPKQKSPTIKTPVREKQTVTKVQKKNLGLAVIGVTASAIAIVAIFWLWLPKQQATVSSIPEPSVTEVITNRDNREQEALETPIINPDRSDDISNNVVEPAVLEPASELELPEILIPQDLESPGKAKNLKIATIKPELTFTPEQTLIAALQTELTELTQNYAEFINSVEVNLAQSSLLIEITGDWYELNETRQNKLANEMLERSRKFDFSDLKLKDSTGKLVARNPVIGDRIIILQRDPL